MTRIEQVKALAKRLDIKDSEMDDFIWTFCTHLIVEMADEVSFGRVMGRLGRKQ